jgi:hypothetical protein
VNSLIKDWRQLPHGSILIHNRQNLDTLLYADDRVLSANSEDNLPLSLHDLNAIAKSHDMEISHEKTEVPAFGGKELVPSKICLNNKLLQSVNSFSCLGYSLSFTYDAQIPNKITTFIKTLRTLNSVTKPSLVEKHIRIKIYESLV